MASPDFFVVGRPWLMEAKWSTSSRWRDGLPLDVESQVQWQLGVTCRERCDVAALVGYELRIYPVEFDDAVFDGLIDIALDFRARLQDGGPFSETLDSLKRRYPADDGTEMVAGGLVAEAVTTLLDVRGRRKALEEDEDRLEVLIKESMGEAIDAHRPGLARVRGSGRKTWSQMDWRSIADGLLRQPARDRARRAGRVAHTTVRKGYRPFRVSEGDRMTTDVALIPAEVVDDRRRKAALLKAMGLDRVPAEQRELPSPSPTYDLDPLLKHLILVEGRPYVTREGLLWIAHRSGELDGIEVIEPAIVTLPGLGEFWRATAPSIART